VTTKVVDDSTANPKVHLIISNDTNGPIFSSVWAGWMEAVIMMRICKSLQSNGAGQPDEYYEYAPLTASPYANIYTLNCTQRKF
jgi:hypothetical protein